jgi:glutamyl-Q tRNA(Asp) synthetase
VAAVASFAQARRADGVWLVRMEDLDPPREIPGAARGIIQDLAAFGMVSDEPMMIQSQRSAAYGEAIEQLLDQGNAFPCGCSRSDLPKSGIYPGTCRKGLPEGKSARSIRAVAPPHRIQFQDQLQGLFGQLMSEEVGDFVIRRADGLTAYQLAVVVDDAEQGMTEIVRGSDLLDSTPRQILLQKYLGLPTPAYIHVPVAVDAKGQKLSKQSRSCPVNIDDPMPALVRAWQFLGQTKPPGQNASSVEEFWSWATPAWEPGRIPTVPSIEIGPL